MWRCAQLSKDVWRNKVVLHYLVLGDEVAAVRSLVSEVWNLPLLVYLEPWLTHEPTGSPRAWMLSHVVVWFGFSPVRLSRNGRTAQSGLPSVIRLPTFSAGTSDWRSSRLS